MRTRRLLPAAFAVMLAGSACVQDPTIPSFGDQAIDLRIAISRQIIRVGEVDTITITATSNLDQTARIVFPSTCQMLIYIRNASGRVSAPENGLYDCVPVPSQLVLAAKASASQKYVWAGFAQLGPTGTTSLPVGDYYISGRIDAQNYSTVAFAVRVTIAP